MERLVLKALGRPRRGPQFAAPLEVGEPESAFGTSRTTSPRHRTQPALRETDPADGFVEIRGAANDLDFEPPGEQGQRSAAALGQADGVLFQHDETASPFSQGR